MSYGLQIMKDDGTLWVSPEVTPLNFISKTQIQATEGASYQSSVPSSKNAVFFVRYNAVGVVSFDDSDINGYRGLTVKKTLNVSTVDIYCFANLAIRKSDYGIFIFNSSGELVYSCDMKPLEIKSTGISVSGDGTIIDMGTPVAVMPFFSGRTSQSNSSLGGYNIFDYHTGATGNSVLNRRLQISSGASGGAGFAYQNTAFYIETNIYDS